MKRKIMAFVTLVTTAIFMQSVAYANVLPEKVMVDYSTEESIIEEETEELVSEQVELQNEEVSVNTYSSSTDNFADVELVASNGTKYTLIANIAYSYDKDTSTSYIAGAQITNVKGDSKTAVIDIVIPESVITASGTFPVVSIGEAAFDTCFATSITVPSSVVEIQDRAFINCPNLTTININGSDDTPKYLNSSSKYYKIPTVIGESVIANCPSLVTANINGFETIGASLFEGCTSLKNVDIHINGFGVNATTGEYNTTARTVAIGDKLFYGCSGLESVKLMDSVKTVGKQTFIGCTSLKKIEIGKTLTGALTYEDFIVVDPVTISDITTAEKQEDSESAVAALHNAEKETFTATSCLKLEEFVVDESNTSFSSIDGILYNKKATTLVYCPYNKNVGALTLPETVTSVSDYSFWYNNNITGLVATGESNLTIAQYAFYKSSVKDVDLYRSGKITIGASAFRDCDSLVSMDTEYNHSGSIGNYGFYNCDVLKELTLLGWNSLGTQAFARCVALESLKCDLGVGTIGDKCFENCTSLKTADLELVGYGLATTTSLKFGTYIFSGCTSLETAVLTDSLLGISTGTFYECTALETVECGNDIANIASYAFFNCSSLKNISDIRYLVKIDKFAFQLCTSLEKITLTRSVTIIDDQAFLGCARLTIYSPKGYAGETHANTAEINYAEIQDDIQDYEFLCYYPVTINSSGTRSVNTKTLYTSTDLLAVGAVPGDSWTIGGYRGGFTTLTIPTDDTCLSNYMNDSWINKYLGNGCSMKPYLTSINMGKVEYIGKSALNGVKTLENLVLCPITKEIGNSAFNGCTLLKGDIRVNSLQLPLTMVLIGESAFAGCTSLEKVDTDIKSNQDLVSTDFNISKLAFSGCTALKEFNTAFLTYDVENDGSNASIKYYLKEIGESAFKNCTSLGKVYFNGNLERIAPKAFENCTSLTAVTLDNSVLVQTNAFIGCTNLVGAIIVGEANVAVSNDPFCSSEGLNIVTTDASKAQTYVDFKNEGKAEDDPTRFTIELREFSTVNSKAYLKSYIQAPADVIVYKNGVKMNIAEEYAIYTNELTFEKVNPSDEKVYSFYVNGVLVTDKYVLSEIEEETLVVTVVEGDKLQKGDVDGNGMVDAADAALTLQHTLNPQSVNLDASAVNRADVDNSSEVNAADSAMILQKVLNSLFEFTA